MTAQEIKHLFGEIYPGRTPPAVRVYEVPASESARGRSFWRAEVSSGSMALNHPGATAREALESLGAELVRVKRSRCDDGPHRLTSAALERLESEGIDPRAVVDAAGRAHDREGVREWVVAIPAREVVRFGEEPSRALASIETATGRSASSRRRGLWRRSTRGRGARELGRGWGRAPRRRP